MENNKNININDTQNKKDLYLRVWCQAFYQSKLPVPEDLTLSEAFEYAKDHIDEIPLTELTYLPDSDNLDDEDLNNQIHTYFDSKENDHRDIQSTKQTLSEDNEFIGQIIDIFEDFLDAKEIRLENELRDDDENPDIWSNIFGDDYYAIEDKLKKLLKNWSL